MDSVARRQRATAHTKHSHTCPCGKTVHGNGGWASHRWSCPTFQASGERYIAEMGRIPDTMANVRRHPKWWHDGTRWCRTIDLAPDETIGHGWKLEHFDYPDTVPVIDSGHREPSLAWDVALAEYEKHAIAHATRIDAARYIQGSPRAGTARPDVCRVTKVTRTTVYYRTETNMLISTGLDKFAASVLAWVES